MKAALKCIQANLKEIWHCDGDEWQVGPPSDVRGDLSNVRGNLSGVRGNLSGVYGDLDNCQLTSDDRAKGVDVEDLIADVKGVSDERR